MNMCMQTAISPRTSFKPSDIMGGRWPCWIPQSALSFYHSIALLDVICVAGVRCGTWSTSWHIQNSGVYGNNGRWMWICAGNCIKRIFRQSGNEILRRLHTVVEHQFASTQIGYGGPERLYSATQNTIDTVVFEGIAVRSISKRNAWKLLSSTSVEIVAAQSVGILCELHFHIWNVHIVDMLQS